MTNEIDIEHRLSVLETNYKNITDKLVEVNTTIDKGFGKINEHLERLEDEKIKARRFRVSMTISIFVGVVVAVASLLRGKGL